MAVFVEGQTEQLFVSKMIREIAGRKNLQIETRKATGSKKRRYLQQLYSDPDFPDVRYYVLIVDCSNYENVVSDMCEQFEALYGQGYARIIGLRDVYPACRRADVARLERSLEKAIRQFVPVPRKPPVVLLAVMEIEAWFIAEHTHFTKIDPTITLELISERFGFDPSRDNCERIDHPARQLDEMYMLAKHRYRKRKREARRTVNNLDYALLYADTGTHTRVPRLLCLVQQIDDFLAS